MIPPTVPGLPPRVFEIRDDGPTGDLRGTVEADNHLQAAGYASRTFYNGNGEVNRYDTWPSAAGVFIDRSGGHYPIFFWVGEPGKLNPPAPGHFRNAADAGIEAAALAGTNPHHVTSIFERTPKPQPKRKRR